MTAADAPTRQARRLAIGLTAATVGWAAFVHHGIGPPFRRGSWIAPSSFLRGDVPDELLPALAVLSLPPLALTVALAFLTKSAFLRTVAGIATLATACFVFYGVQASFPWRFFHWRWSLCVILFAVVVGGALHAPQLAAAWRRLGWPLRLATYVPLLALLVAYETSVTGTDPELRLALSPWPMVQMLGLEFLAAWVAAICLGVGIGLLGATRGALGGMLGFVGAAAVQVLAVRAATATGALLFKPEAAHYVVAIGSALAVLMLARLWPPRDRPALGVRAHHVLLGGVLLAVPLGIGQMLTFLDYTETRENRAQRIIDALARFEEAHQGYPDALDELVESGFLESVPTPRIGLSGQDFVYQNFGDSYLLEFSAPRWIQCAYNPPWALEPGEEVDPEDEDALRGAWSCPQNPPEIW